MGKPLHDSFTKIWWAWAAFYQKIFTDDSALFQTLNDYNFWRNEDISTMFTFLLMGSWALLNSVCFFQISQFWIFRAKTAKTWNDYNFWRNEDIATMFTILLMGSWALLNSVCFFQISQFWIFSKIWSHFLALVKL